MFNWTRLMKEKFYGDAVSVSYMCELGKEARWY